MKKNFPNLEFSQEKNVPKVGLIPSTSYHVLSRPIKPVVVSPLIPTVRPIRPIYPITLDYT